MTPLDPGRSTALRLLIGLTAFTTLAVGAATAYVLDGRSWPHPPGPIPTVTYDVCATNGDVDGFSTLVAIVNAGITWNYAGARFQFNFGSPRCNAAPARDGVNQIRFDAGSVYPYPAATYVWSSGATITEVDTIFDDIYPWSTATPVPYGSIDIQSVMLHEFGHWLSLDHSVPPAVMQPSVSYGDQRRALTDDDKQGIVKIYGCK